jgi:hypothetical protein
MFGLSISGFGKNATEMMVVMLTLISGLRCLLGLCSVKLLFFFVVNKYLGGETSKL